MASGDNHLKELILALARARVRFIVAGGVALVLHGIERMTVDLDIMLDFEQANVERFLSCMDDLKLVPRAPVPAAILKDGEKVKAMVERKHALVFTFIDPSLPYRQLDVFISPDLNYEKYQTAFRTIDLDGEAIPVLTLQALLELKLRIAEPRDKDLFDIKALRKLMEKPHD